MHELYDVITKQTIILPIKGIVKAAKQIGLDNMSLAHLREGRDGLKCLKNRYILPENKHLIFSLVDFDTDEEFDCINNFTLFLHLNLPYHENEAKYIYELKRGRQRLSSIGNRVFYLKGNKPIRKAHNLKNFSPELKKLQENQLFIKKIKNKLRKRMHAAFFSSDIKKTTKTEILLGCKISFFIGYIEALFTKGMTWDNQGEWHIDHLVPCCSFDLSKVEEQCKCFHYKNLRPLWGTTETAIKYGESKDYVGNLNRERC